MAWCLPACMSSCPDNDPLQRNAVPASASVFIRHEPSLDINTLIPQIKTLVANGIAGLTYEKVSVIPVAAATTNPTNTNSELTSFLGIWMLTESAAKARWLLEIWWPPCSGSARHWAMSCGKESAGAFTPSFPLGRQSDRKPADTK